MRSYLYLSTAVAGVIIIAGAGSVWAQCLIIPECVSLGYKEISCPDGNGVKCPFGNTFACAGTDVDCSTLGYDKTCTGAGEVGSGPTCNGKYASCTCDTSYQYTCTGTGYSAGSGTACGGKYTSCKCSSGYKWKNGACKRINPCSNKSNGAYNEVYCCNGIVVGVKAQSMDFYVAMVDLDLGLTSRYSANLLCQNYSFCGGLRGPLPSWGQLQTIYNNKSRINTLLSTNGGTKMREGNYWSFTRYNNDYSYFVNMSNNKGEWNSDSYSIAYVRPVLTSW